MIVMEDAAFPDFFSSPLRNLLSLMLTQDPDNCRRPRALRKPLFGVARDDPERRDSVIAAGFHLPEAECERRLSDASTKSGTLTGSSQQAGNEASVGHRTRSTPRRLCARGRVHSTGNSPSKRRVCSARPVPSGAGHSERQSRTPSSVG
jgi:hypothetical protein